MVSKRGRDLALTQLTAQPPRTARRRAAGPAIGAEVGDSANDRVPAIGSLVEDKAKLVVGSGCFQLKKNFV